MRNRQTLNAGIYIAAAAALAWLLLRRNTAGNTNAAVAAGAAPTVISGIGANIGAGADIGAALSDLLAGKLQSGNLTEYEGAAGMLVIRDPRPPYQNDVVAPPGGKRPAPQ